METPPFVILFNIKIIILNPPVKQPPVNGRRRLAKGVDQTDTIKEDVYGSWRRNLSEIAQELRKVGIPPLPGGQPKRLEHP
jgi:hypothetical protein